MEGRCELFNGAHRLCCSFSALRSLALLFPAWGVFFPSYAVCWFEFVNVTEYTFFVLTNVKDFVFPSNDNEQTFLILVYLVIVFFSPLFHFGHTMDMYTNDALFIFSTLYQYYVKMRVYVRH